MWPIILFFTLFFWLFLPRNMRPNELQTLHEDLRSHVTQTKQAAAEQKRREQALEELVLYEAKEVKQRKKWSVTDKGVVEYTNFETVN